MSVHVAAFYSSIADTADDQDIDLSVVSDEVLATAGTGSDAFYIPAGTRIVGAYAAGYPNVGSFRLNSPTFLEVTPPFIRPYAGGPTALGADIIPTPNNPNFQDLMANPLRFRRPDTLGVRCSTGTLTATSVGLSLVWLCDEFVPAPPGPRFAWGFSSSTTATAQKWTSLDATFQNTLPEGRYAVVGVEHWTTDGPSTAIGVRLIIPGQSWRPGALSQGNDYNRTARSFYEERFGTLGTFSSFAPPVPQVFCNGADTEHYGMIHVVRLAD